MENEIKLVNNVEGSIVSDKMLNKVNDLTEANRRIGQLEGELRVAELLVDQNIKETNNKLKEASKKVEVVLKDEANTSRKLVGIARNCFGDIVEYVENYPNEIQSVTIENEDLTKLADATVKADAELKVSEAEKIKKEAEKKVKTAEEKVEKSKEYWEKELKQYSKTERNRIEAAVERVEKRNQHQIDELNLKVKTLEKETDLLVDKNINLTKERDLAIEAMDQQIKLLKNKIKILERPVKGTLAAIKRRMNMWYFNHRLQKVEMS